MYEHEFYERMNDVMENKLTVIDQRDVLGHDFKMYGTFEEPLFLAKDVAVWIEHSNARAMLQTVDETEKVKVLHPVNNPYGGYQEEEQWFLTERDLTISYTKSKQNHPAPP